MSEQNNQTGCISFSLSSERLDDEQLLDLLTALRSDLSALPEVKRVEPPKPKGIKEGSKGVEVDVFNTIVTLSTAAGGGLITLLVAWLRSNRRVEIEFSDGNQYGLKKVSAASLEQVETVLEKLKRDPESPIITL